MRILTLLAICFSCLNLNAQVSEETTLSRCPVFITDTVSANNFFIEARPALLKVYRVKGKLTVAVDQKGQLVSFYFHDKRLKTGKYKIEVGSRSSREVEAIYSFKSGDQVSFIDISSGTINVTYDKAAKLWNLKITGLLANMALGSVTYYKVAADLSLNKLLFICCIVGYI